MLHPSTKKLIDKLSEMTRRQRVSWLQGEDGKIYHDTEGFRVILTPAPHQVLITDALGKAIESASDAEFAGITDAHNRPYAQFVGELYREADRCARGAERAIDLLLKGLDKTEDAPVTAARVPEPVNEAPEDLADELASTESLVASSSTDVQGITDAVASLADEVNGAAETAAAPVTTGPGAAWIPVAGSALAGLATEAVAEVPETLAPIEAAPVPVPVPLVEPVVAEAAPAPTPFIIEPTPVESAVAIETIAPGYEEAEAPEADSAADEAERMELMDLQQSEPAPALLDSAPEPVAAEPQPVPVAPPASSVPPPVPPVRYPQFGNYGRPFAPAPAAPPPAPAPQPEPVAAEAPAPAPAAAPPPAPAPAPVPMTAQRFSLSGLGVGAAASPSTPPPVAPAPAPVPAPPPVPAQPPVAAEAPVPPPREEALQFTTMTPPSTPEPILPEPASRPLFQPVEAAAPEEKTPEPAEDGHGPARPRRFNPWQ